MSGDYFITQVFQAFVSLSHATIDISKFFHSWLCPGTMLLCYVLGTFYIITATTTVLITFQRFFKWQISHKPKVKMDTVDRM